MCQSWVTSDPKYSVFDLFRKRLLNVESLYCRYPAASDCGWGVCGFYAQLERERLSDTAGSSVAGQQQPLHKGVRTTSNACYNLYNLRSDVMYAVFVVQLGQLIASTCKELPGPKECRRTAKELWEVVVQICSVSSQHKRSSDGRVSLLKHRDSSLGILPRWERTIRASFHHLAVHRNRHLDFFIIHTEYWISTIKCPLLF